MVKPAGFTLIELLVVVVIMLGIFALVPPMFNQGVSGPELKAAARKVAAGLRKVHAQAISQKKEAALTMDVEARRFELTGDKRVYQLPPKIDISLYTAKSEISAEKSGAIRFFPDGSSTGGRVTLAAGERKFLVDVNWLTGRVGIID